MEGINRNRLAEVNRGSSRRSQRLTPQIPQKTELPRASPQMNEPTPYSHRFLACEDAAAHGMRFGGCLICKLSKSRQLCFCKRQAAHVLICVAHAVQKTRVLEH